MTSGIVMGLLAIVFVVFAILGTTGITAGACKGAVTVTVTGTVPPQGNATSSSVPSQQVVVTSAVTEALAFGTASGQCDTIVCQDRTLAASTAETLTLNDSSLKDVGGAGVVLAHLKFLCIYIVVGTGDVSGMSIGGGASNPYVLPLSGTTPVITVYPGGPPYLAGEPTVGFVVSSTHKTITITNLSSAVAVTYRLVLGGTTT